jgi:hypothetical protein
MHVTSLRPLSLLFITSLVTSLATLGACIITTSDGDTDDTAGSSASASQGGSASATDTAASAGTDAGATSVSDDTATDDSAPTTDAVTSESGAVDSSSGDATTAADTGATGSTCGWVDAKNFYNCGGEGVDPKGFHPIACPEPPVAGTPCKGGEGPIPDPGCCEGDLNAYCYLGELVVVDCTMQ